MTREVPTRARVNWRRIADAVEYYEREGFTYVETPWRVHENVILTTKPPEAVAFRCDLADKTRPHVLVGSAEQGFLSVMSTLQPGYYVSVSPCFRDNEVDALHFSDFMKVELCVVAPTLSPGYVSCRLLDTAQRFMYSEGLLVTTTRTSIGTDLVSDTGGVEVGSYGWRRAVIDGVEHTWVYGTGIAEPRFSQALERQRQHKE